MSEIFTAKAPGKLFLVGEYAVLDGCPAFIIAIDRFVEATFETAETFSAPEGELIASAVDTTREYLKEKGITPRPGKLSIKNGLVDENGNKLGLGSSGAICTAVCEVLLEANGIHPSVSLLFRLSAIAECQVQPNGSFGDVAAAVCGGFFEYTPVNARWLGSQINSYSIKGIVENHDWHLATADRYPWPDTLHILVGWTGESSSTPSAIKKYQAAKKKKEKETESFVENIKESIILPFEKALDRGDTARIKSLITESYSLVKTYGASLGLPLKNKKLTQLVKIAEKHGVAAKPTGSWGGDCGIALCEDEKTLEEIAEEWKQAGITPLHLGIAPGKIGIDEH